MNISMNLFGYQALVSKLREIERSIYDAIGAAIYWFAGEIMDESMSMTPLDTGETRDSAYVTAPFRSGSSVSVEFGYGAKQAPYIHERTDLNFRVGSSKFLEKAIYKIFGSKMAALGDRLAESIDKKSTYTRGKYNTRPTA